MLSANLYNQAFEAKRSSAFYLLSLLTGQDFTYDGILVRNDLRFFIFRAWPQEMNLLVLF